MPWIDLAGQKRADTAMPGDSGFVRVSGDRYYTEPWITDTLMQRVRFRGPVWEPACGRGDMLNVIRRYDYETIASDIEPQYRNGIPLDFLDIEAISFQFNSIVTNLLTRWPKRFYVLRWR